MVVPRAEASGEAGDAQGGKSRLTGPAQTLSSLAAGMCFVNCTVLPPVVAALPVMSVMSPDSVAALQHVLHAASAYFVLPVGSLAVGLAHAQHRRPAITALGAGGLGVLAAATFGFLPHGAHHAGMIAGSAGLLGSNFWGRREARKQQRTCCGGSKPKA